MNMILLKEPPANAWSYMDPPDSILDGHALEEWIRDIIRQGAYNLHIAECYLQTIDNVEADLIAAKYKVQILPIEGTSASAEFYLERIPV